MWSSVSNAISSLGLKKSSREPSRASFSDDESCSNASSEEGLECPICWESFNIVENVPYVLWCGHTLCKNCVLGLHWASLKFCTQQIQIPLFISCPWCHLLTLRLVYRGNLKFPRKNFFLLWMVESLNGDRKKSPAFLCGEHQQNWCPRSTSLSETHSRDMMFRRPHYVGDSMPTSDGGNHDSSSSNLERPHLSLHKSLDFFLHLTEKFPLVVILLLIVLLAIPASAAILALYLVITVVFALPSFLVLYFAYPALDWLAREITS